MICSGTPILVSFPNGLLKVLEIDDLFVNDLCSDGHVSEVQHMGLMIWTDQGFKQLHRVSRLHGVHETCVVLTRSAMCVMDANNACVVNQMGHTQRSCDIDMNTTRWLQHGLTNFSSYIFRNTTSMRDIETSLSKMQHIY